MRPFVSVGLVVALSACGPKLPPLPSAGGPRWIELTSAHFRFFTDGTEDQARRVVKQMEDVRSVIYGAVFPDAPPGGQTVVIALHAGDEASIFVPRNHSAFAVPPNGSPLRGPLIVMPIDTTGHAETATHELAHALSSNAIHDQPRWFAEGLATYFQTITIDGQDVTVGKRPDDIASGFGHRVLWLRPVAAVFRCRAFRCLNTMFYWRAWALFAYLRNTHPRELIELGRVIDEGARRKAWQRVFPDLTDERLNDEVIDWLLNGKLSAWHYKLEPVTWPTAVRTLGESEVLSLRAMLWSLWHSNSPEVDGNLKAALARDPNDLLANYLVARLRWHHATVPRANAILRAHPKSWLAWWLLHDALQPGPQAEVVRATMCELVARDPAIDPPRSCRALTRGDGTGGSVGSSASASTGPRS